jgi:1-deoxy-D-xylulose-5-phosphate synthase
MLYTASTLRQPSAVRYPRGTGTGATIVRNLEALPVGRGVVRREGRSGLTILAFGTLLSAALEAGDRQDATVVDMRFVKPMDEALVLQLAARSEGIVTLEENAVAGGAGSAVCEVLDAAQCLVPRLCLGIPDRFIEHGSREDCLEAAGLDTRTVVARIDRWWKALTAGLNRRTPALTLP